MFIDRSCNQRTTLVKGQTYPLTITGSYQNSCWIKAFIDYNNDGDFDDPGETLISTFAFSGSATAGITIPSTGVITGIPLRLRVIAEDPSFEPTACHLTGVPATGAGQVEDYGVILANRLVVSTGSGPWNVPGTWLCNCVPQAGDEVTIKAGHTVNITPAMGVVQCVKLNLETGSHFDVSGTFTITGN